MCSQYFSSKRHVNSSFRNTSGRVYEHNRNKSLSDFCNLLNFLRVQVLQLTGFNYNFFEFEYVKKVTFLMKHLEVFYYV